MDRYEQLIKSLPVNEHAFTSKKKTWGKFIKMNIPSSEILSEIFIDKDEIEISRADLFDHAKEGNIEKLIIATILWGYPGGMRGNHFINISNSLEEIKTCLEDAKNGIEDWNEHYEKTIKIEGLGLSTYTKLLYFCGAKVKGIPCVILDKRIIDTIGKQAISGLEELNGIALHNASKKYPKYLNIIHHAASRYCVPHGSVEMFIFAFGLNIKPYLGPKN